ncbi:MAG TPA: ATP-binding protein [Methanothrix sp.]|nr:ATP-binding protein [Methanothrix sp.]HPJ83550.1 ATP-binding protein [Methanothrix sp.]HPR66212.1 ATP-binding protein [Methanothrix sp.]
MKASFGLLARGSLDELPKISDFILDSTEGSELDQRERYHLMMAVDEACTNIIKYGGSTEIEIRCHVEGERVEVEITDDGVAFNPLEAPAPEISAPLEEREVGGLGIHFIRTLTTDVKYEHRQGKNNLTMTLRHRQNNILRK